MKYISAAAVLPAALLEEVQNFTEGRLLYIPTRPGRRRCWGASTDTRTLIENRNSDMQKDRLSGLSVRALALKYHLSESTVKKIVYKK
jgi:Mor family transcriptional regulator